MSILKLIRIRSERFVVGLVIAGVVAVMLMSLRVVVDARHIKTLLTELQAHPFLVTGAVQDIQHALIESQIRIDNLSAYYNADEVELTKKELTELRPNVDDKVRYVTDFYLGPQKDAAGLAETVFLIRELEDDIIAHTGDDAPAENATIIASKLRPLYTRGREQARVIKDFARQKIIQFASDAADLATASVVSAIVVALVMIAFAALLLATIKRGLIDKISTQAQFQQSVFSTLSDNIDQVFLIYNVPRKSFEHIFQNSHRILGLDAETIQTDPLILCNNIHPDDRCEVVALFGSDAAPIRYDRDIRYKKPTASDYCWFNLTMTPVVKHGKVFRAIFSFTDLTERHKTQHLLHNALQNAQAANCVKSEFLTSISHEIRTPMNAILGLSYLCLQTHLNSIQRNYLEKSQEAATKLLRIVDDMLDFSKIDAGKLGIDEVPFRLSGVVDEVIDVLGGVANNKGLPLRIEIDDSLPSDVVGDPIRIRQVLLSLVSNAIKFTEQGEVVLTLRQDASKTNETTIGVTFTVSDTGIGMTSEQVSRLFTPFTQGDGSMNRKHGGTGLGLIISKSLIELMGGVIDVTSTPGSGTSVTFTISFAAVVVSDTVDPCHDVDLSDCRVLVVDDCSTDRKVISQLVHAITSHVDTVESGDHAISALLRASTRQKDYDIVLIDWKMPRMDGVETARAIRANTSLANQPAILLMSAYDKTEFAPARWQKLASQDSCINQSLPVFSVTLSRLPSALNMPALLSPRRHAHSKERVSYWPKTTESTRSLCKAFWIFLKLT
ncbi:MAG: ATP-binding protein [Thermoguttaceae bacterium]